METTKYQLQKQKKEQKIKKEFAESIIKRMIQDLGNKNEIVFPKEIAEIIGIKTFKDKQTVGLVYGVPFITN